MAKRSTKAKRSLQALPKGLPSKKRKAGTSATDQINPFDTTSRNKKPKHEVHNRFSSSKTELKPSKLAQSLSRRQEQVREHYQGMKKVNAFLDRRLGEYDSRMTPEEQAVARLVKERSRRSQRQAKYALDEELLTHGGMAVNDATLREHVMLSDDEDEKGNLEPMDTELHFGGGGGAAAAGHRYGPSTATPTDLTQVYAQRKTELDDLIARRRMLKAERLKSKEQQSEAFETMDDSFKELAQLLQFRDKKEEKKERETLKAKGLLPQDDKEMAEWDKEMKEYLFARKVKATDRTKTPEELAKEEADRLHELETRRLARMNGDFEDDDLSDISGDEGMSKKKNDKKKKPSKNSRATAEKLDDSDEEVEEESTAKVRFTSEGLCHVDKDGNIVGKVGEEKKDDNGDSDDEGNGSDEEDEDDDEEESDEEETSMNKEKELEGYDPSIFLPVGTRVNGNYRVTEQFGEQDNWYPAKISQVNKDKDRGFTYNLEYDDGDFEDDVDPENVRPIAKTDHEKESQRSEIEEEIVMKRLRQKAKLKAR